MIWDKRSQLGASVTNPVTRVSDMSEGRVNLPPATKYVYNRNGCNKCNKRCGFVPSCENVEQVGALLSVTFDKTVAF